VPNGDSVHVEYKLSTLFTKFHSSVCGQKSEHLPVLSMKCQPWQANLAKVVSDPDKDVYVWHLEPFLTVIRFGPNIWAWLICPSIYLARMLGSSSPTCSYMLKNCHTFQVGYLQFSSISERNMFGSLIVCSLGTSRAI